MIPGSEFSMADTFVGLANRYRDKPAIVDGDNTLSFRDLLARSAGWAGQLLHEGVGPGDRVGVACRKTTDTLNAILSLWLIGAVPVPMDFRSRGAERSAIASDFALSAILEDRVLPDATYSAILCNPDWQGRGADRPLELSAHRPPPAGPAYIALTSGTTGRPAGIMISHHAIFFRSYLYRGWTGTATAGRSLYVYPLSFSASRNCLIGTLVRGDTAYIHPPLFDTPDLIEAINRHKITYMFVVPATLSGLLAEARSVKGPIVPTLSGMLCGGAGMPADDKLEASRLITSGFIHNFASTATGTLSVLGGQDLQERPQTDGRVHSHVRMEIADEQGRPLDHGQPGQVRVRSPAMAYDIYSHADRSMSDRIKDNWIYTGDMGVLSEDGFITIVGRASDLIIRGGLNVYPAEIQKALEAMNGVQAAAVTGYPDDVLGEEIAAFVQADTGVTPDLVEAHCRASLSPGKRPRRIIMVAQLPRNANGKVLVDALRKQL